MPGRACSRRALPAARPCPPGPVPPAAGAAPGHTSGRVFKAEQQFLRGGGRWKQHRGAVCCSLRSWSLGAVWGICSGMVLCFPCGAWSRWGAPSGTGEGGKLCSMWWGFRKSRCRWVVKRSTCSVPAPQKLAGICRKRFPAIWYQLKIKLDKIRAVVLGMC